MLTKQEIDFIDYWEANRDKESTFMHKFLMGLPMAVLFGLPILLLILVVYLFFPDWYAKVGASMQGSFVMIIISVVLLIIFFAYFRKHFEWEAKENQYLHLKKKAAKDATH